MDVGSSAGWFTASSADSVPLVLYRLFHPNCDEHRGGEVRPAGLARLGRSGRLLTARVRPHRAALDDHRLASSTVCRRRARRGLRAAPTSVLAWDDVISERARGTVFCLVWWPRCNGIALGRRDHEAISPRRLRGSGGGVVVGAALASLFMRTTASQHTAHVTSMPALFVVSRPARRRRSRSVAGGILEPERVAHALQHAPAPSISRAVRDTREWWVRVSRLLVTSIWALWLRVVEVVRLVVGDRTCRSPHAIM
jgi:hypothetical protein